MEFLGWTGTGNRVRSVGRLPAIAGKQILLCVAGMGPGVGRGTCVKSQSRQRLVNLTFYILRHGFRMAIGKRDNYNTRMNGRQRSPVFNRRRWH